MAVSWNGAGTLQSIEYTCGYCDNDIASNKGYSSADTRGIRICHFCGNPSFFDGRGGKVPGSFMGNPVKNIDDEDLATLYKEARQCGTANAYTAAVLACRKILMHIAVDKGDDTGKSFLQYVEYLSDNNYIPRDAKGWVDYIRQKGNEANHEIVLMEKDDAERLISCIEMLLKVIYDFPARIPTAEEE